MNNTLTYRRILLTIVSLLSLVACNSDFDIPEEPVPDSPGTITLHLKNSNMSRSVDSDNAETAIRNLYIGLYANAEPLPGIGISQNEMEPAVVWLPLDDLDENGSYTVTAHLTDNIVKKLFGENAKTGDVCKFFVLANIFEPITVPENASIHEMKNLAIKTEFMSEAQTSFVMAGEGEAFYEAAKDGEEAGKVSGTASLIRAAAKIRLNVRFAETVTTDDESGQQVTWKPVVDNNAIKVLINNGVREAIAVPESSEGPWKPGGNVLAPGGGELLLSEENNIDFNGTGDPYYSSSLRIQESVRYLSYNASSDDDLVSQYPYQMDVPFYTYPNAWFESPDETHKTTLTLIIPWHREGDPEGSNYTFYYQVPVTPDVDSPTKTASIRRNTSYNIYLNVGMLGNIVPDDPVELDDLSYRVVDWGDESIDAEISDYRYLVVSPNVYTISNEDVISIPFYTTHDCEISEITMSYQRFNYPNNGSGEVVEIPISKEVIDESIYMGSKICDYTIEHDSETNQWYIKITHPMIMWTPVDNSGKEVNLTEKGEVDGKGYLDENKLDDVIQSIVRYKYPDNPEMAYFPYTFHLTIRHKDNYTFYEDVTITQYPGMYIVADRNFGGKYLSYDFISDNDKLKYDHKMPDPRELDYGFVFLNPEQEITSNGIVWRNSDLWGPELDNIVDREMDKAEVMSQYREHHYKGLGGLKVYEGLSTSGNVANPNMYVLNITQLSPDGMQSKYVIGDPRSKKINNLLTNESMAEGSALPAGEWCQSAASFYPARGAQRTLTYYYPTDETEASRMMVAPKLRISSAFGFVRATTNIIDCTLGRRRAATYQEQGYPAGRWRLPTFGEVQFIVMLSEEKKIPVLFQEGMSYLTAQGAYTVQDGALVPTEEALQEKYEGNYQGTVDRGVPFDVWYSNRNGKWTLRSDNGVNVRPVYDEWYWEQQDGYQLNKDESGGYIYTLGDIPVNSN